MAKRPTYTGGAASAKARGMRRLTIPVTAEAYAAIQRAAADCDPPMPVTRWAAGVLEAAATTQKAPNARGECGGEGPHV